MENLTSAHPRKPFAPEFLFQRAGKGFSANLRGTTVSALARAVLTGALVFFLPGTNAGSPPPPAVSERGPHSQRIQHFSHEIDKDGKTAWRTHSYVQLGTGLNRWSVEKKQWVAANDQLEWVGGRAIGRGTQHRVAFAANTRSPAGLVDLETPGGERIIMRPVGLAVTDATGRSFFLAEVKASAGELVAPNTILYRDAFDLVNASISLKTTLDGIESDIILAETIERDLLEQLGIDPETAKLEVWHQVLKRPQFRKRVGALHRKSGEQHEDHTVDFGGMSISAGTAFTIAADQRQMAEAGNALAVAKEFVTVEGMDFLIESVPYADAAPELDQLPRPPAPIFHGGVETAASVPRRYRAREGRTRPLPPPYSVARSDSASQVAMTSLSSSGRNGFVIDYPITLASHSNFTFRGDTTYYVTNRVLLTGTTRLEGGAVIKTEPYNPAVQAQVRIMGDFECLTSPYQPAIFTARDDDTVGEVVAGSLGVPLTNIWYSTYNLYFAGTNSVELHDIQTRHGHVGVFFGNPGPHHAWNLQVFRCYRGIEYNSGAVYLRNALLHHTRYAINPYYSTTGSVHAEHLTIDTASNLFGSGANATLFLTNSLFRNVGGTGNSNVSLSHVQAVNPSAFQIVGRGRHYLATNSLVRDTGTTNVSPAMSAILRSTTTVPPALLAGPVVANTILLPIVPRDADVPDLGFHYYPLDYCLGEVVIENATLSLESGVTLGTYGTHGFVLSNGGRLVSQGHPLRWNRIVPFQAVQGEPVAWGARGQGLFRVASVARAIELRYTESSVLASSPAQRELITGLTDSANGIEPFSASDCRFVNFSQVFRTLRPSTITARNNIFERCAFVFEQGATRARTYSPLALDLSNNLFLDGTNMFNARSGAAPWRVHDNFFLNESLIAIGTPAALSASHNAFRPGILPFGGPGNQVAITPQFQSGPLGTFYYAPGMASLLDAGSRPAGAAGLYHATTDPAALAREGNSIVDIGFHYPAVDSNLAFADTDADGISDPTEDPNGNGVQDPGETKHTDRDSDLDGETDGDEVSAGTDPLSAQSVSWKSLASWHFDDGTLVGVEGQTPLAETNLTISPGFEGGGLMFTNTNGPVVLQYRGLESNGKPNVSLAQGSIRFRLQSFWFSDDPDLDIPNNPSTYRGVGPGEWITLVETANLAVRIDPKGTNIFVISKTVEGQTITNLSGRIRLESDNARPNSTAPGKSFWTEVLITYSPQETKLVWAAPNAPLTGSGIPLWSGASTANQTLNIGSAPDGTGKINALIDDLVIYNVPGILHTNPWQFSAIAQTNPVALNLVWNAPTNLLLNVKRRAMGSTQWQWLPGAIGTNLVDSTVVPGERYEYNLNAGFLHPDGVRDEFGNSMTASVLGRPLESRGKVMLLVDETLAAGLQPELGTFITNLVGDGWSVLRGNMPRHIDDYTSPAAFATNYFNITNRIKPFIRSNHNAFPGQIKHLLIVGHVAIPYTGDQADDGHWSTPSPGNPYGSHQGTWASDMFYGDVDGVWRDSKTVTWSANPENWNAPADGKLDEDYIPANSEGVAEIEFPVARIDFARLPAFAETETELVKRYLRKNSQYRHQQLSFAPNAIGTDLFFSFQSSLVPVQMSVESASKLAVLNPGIQGDVFTHPGSFVVGAQSGPGFVDRINDSRPQEQTTVHFATNRTAPSCAFYFFRSSFFQDWNLNNNFMRAVLAPTNGGLAAGWVLSMGVWRLDSLASGLELGFGSREVLNTRLKPFWGGQSGRATQILGDSTLRYPVLAPPSGLIYSLSNNLMQLNWTAAPGPDVTYNVYLSVTGLNGNFTKLNQAPLAATSFTAGPRRRGTMVFMVRGLKVASTGAGSFTNLSQGIFVSP